MNTGKNKIKPAWPVIFFLFWAFILLFSYLFPLGRDEYFVISKTPREIWDISLAVFWYHSPKIGVFFGILTGLCGKPLFLILNPFIQTAVVLGIFYFINLRLPDFKTGRDIPAVILTMLLCVFAAAHPAQTVFWIGGALNYSWTFLLFIFFLCLLRGFYNNKINLPDNYFTVLLLFPPALFLGLGNENNAPMALAVFCAFFALAVYEKRPLPRWFYFCAFAVFCGVFYMFTAPALYTRRALSHYEFTELGLLQKVAAHMPNLGAFIRDNLFLPVINTILISLLAFKNGNYKKQNFVLAVCCLLISFALAFVLFFAPFAGGRVFYSASLFSIISFLFLLTFTQERFTRLLAAAALGAAVVIMPLFAVPYINLHKQDAARSRLLKEAKSKGSAAAPLPYFLVISGPSGNLTIAFYDVLYADEDKVAEQLGIKAAPIALLPAQNHSGKLSVEI